MVNIFYCEIKIKFSLANSFVRYQACSFSCNLSYATIKDCRDSCCLRPRPVEGEPSKAFEGL